MKCPVCENANLLMSERQGIEIDYCPQCRGVWLDRGELDKIIERSLPTAAAPSPDTRPQNQAPQAPPPVQAAHTSHHYEQPRQTQHYQNHPHQGGHYKKKKEGFLSELFDFD
ncbi:zf-TFIIB domain-containing protein [Undibacterium sp. LX40W]|uniref:Zf-TFIIB domain-containing protein n=1 Tax=Undibacterium nitidum TaxID=2762298 RepID=A0A923KUG1_9BURK|nr:MULTISPECIES: zf-TFIIB domain-containing protein [Undibacterium]MBC3882659.1 zf-TFIIB domain-containing protein [Undibacterium nitidum]MBC3892940.1 zf-TFIIB domain-containing protein [Undibacterium sp. LX40W]